MDGKKCYAIPCAHFREGTAPRHPSAIITVGNPTIYDCRVHGEVHEYLAPDRLSPCVYCHNAAELSREGMEE